MKQGIKNLMQIDCGISIEKIDSIDFIFLQGNTEKTFSYPSEAVYQIADTEIGIEWDVDDLAEFSTEKFVKMDSKIYLKDSEFPPETAIERFFISDTLFVERNGA